MNDGGPRTDHHHKRECTQQKIVDRHGTHKPRSSGIFAQTSNRRNIFEDGFRYQTKDQQESHTLFCITHTLLTPSAASPPYMP